MKQNESNPVSNNFNPYAEWLGLPEAVTSPDHCQLLGIHESVTDPAAIASAADRAMTRVRACKPGPHAAAWAQLLDRISAAKTTLTDPELRQSYLNQLAPQAIAAAAPVNPNFLPPTNSAPQQTPAPWPAAQSIDPMAPVLMSPQPATPQVPQPAPVAAVPMAVPYLQAATPAVAAPNPMAPVGQAASMAPVMPANPQAVPNPMAPAAPIAHAIPAAPVTSPIPAVQPMAPAQTQTVNGAPKLKRKPTTTSRAQSKSGGMLGPILLGGSVGGLILVVVGVAFVLSGSQRKPPSPPVAAVSPETPSTDPANAASTLPRRLDEIPESERPQVTTYTPPAQVPPTTVMETPPAMTPPAGTPAPMTPAPVTPAPSEPSPEPMSDSGLSLAQLRALAQSLTTARAAIGEQNFPVADRELAKAQALAKADEHQAKLARLQLLRDYVGRYRAAIGETLGRTGGGDQIDFGNGISFGIVEVTPDLLVIRVSGQNRRYPMNELPLGLATRLAEMSLDKDSPDTAAMKAAFVSVNPKISDDDREKAAVWWKEAASVGDVPDLIVAIDDDYSLKQDLMDVPIEAGALAALTARADRLKDARTIEEFASEFQATIDESLKTLEPGLELGVGGSTMVTIKELKSDRVLLTVAGETRGFQITKLPLGLAASIAERILPRDVPLSMVMKGAYYAAREKSKSDKQFRPIVLDWWKQAGEMDQQLQPVIQELVKQYPE